MTRGRGGARSHGSVPLIYTSFLDNRLRQRRIVQHAGRGAKVDEVGIPTLLKTVADADPQHWKKAIRTQLVVEALGLGCQQGRQCFGD